MSDADDTKRVIQSFSIPGDILKATEHLMIDQEKNMSQIIRGSLLMAWPDHYAQCLGVKRYQQVIRQYHDPEEP